MDWNTPADDSHASRVAIALVVELNCAFLRARARVCVCVCVCVVTHRDRCWKRSRTSSPSVPQLRPPSCSLSAALGRDIRRHVASTPAPIVPTTMTMTMTTTTTTTTTCLRDKARRSKCRRSTCSCCWSFARARQQAMAEGLSSIIVDHNLSISSQGRIDNSCVTTTSSSDARARTAAARHQRHDCRPACSRQSFGSSRHRRSTAASCFRRPPTACYGVGRRGTRMRRTSWA